MTHPHMVRCTLAGLLLVLASHRSAGQTAAAGDGLAFFGFRPGATLLQVGTRVDAGGGKLRCDRAKADAHVRECRAALNDPALGGRVSLWMSSMDSLSGVLTLSADVSPEQLAAWRGALERSYGQVGAKARGTQWMMQWVRRGTMIRLTWRVDRGAQVASVSLIDGQVLDGWGRSRARAGHGG